MAISETQQLQGQVALGQHVEGFLTSATGNYLIARAEAEIQEALEALKTVDCTDAKAKARRRRQSRCCFMAVAQFRDLIPSTRCPQSYMSQTAMTKQNS